MVKSKSAQDRYRAKAEFDEYLLGTFGQYAQPTCVHEIVYGSRRTFEEWNMIALSNGEPYWHHDRAHSIRYPVISKRELFIAKIRLGHQVPPDEILREFDLAEIVKADWGNMRVDK